MSVFTSKQMSAGTKRFVFKIRSLLLQNKYKKKLKQTTNEEVRPTRPVFEKGASASSHLNWSADIICFTRPSPVTWVGKYQTIGVDLPVTHPLAILFCLRVKRSTCLSPCVITSHTSSVLSYSTVRQVWGKSRQECSEMEVRPLYEMHKSIKCSKRRFSWARFVGTNLVEQVVDGSIG